MLWVVLVPKWWICLCSKHFTVWEFSQPQHVKPTYEIPHRLNCDMLLSPAHTCWCHPSITKHIYLTKSVRAFSISETHFKGVNECVFIHLSNQEIHKNQLTQVTGEQVYMYKQQLSKQISPFTLVAYFTCIDRSSCFLTFLCLFPCLCVC